jgi:hypothetical protein
VKVTKGIMRRFLGKIIIHEPKWLWRNLANGILVELIHVLVCM